MAIGRWRPKPLVITPEDTVEQRRGGRYVCTATWGSIEEADKGLSRPVRPAALHPLHDRQISRVGWWGEQVVGHVGVLRIPLRLGRATVVAAGIAGVCADPRARKHGIASTLMRDALRASREAGLSFSMLFGIANFYHRFGFVPAFPRHTISTNAQDLPTLPRWRARRATVKDLPRMREAYDQLYGRIDGTAVRHPQLFFRRKGHQRYILQGPARGDRAYVIARTTKVAEKEELEVIEAAGQGAGWPAAVMAWSARQAEKQERSKVIFHLPPQHPVCGRLTFGSALVEVRHSRNADAMVAVLDFAGLAREMAPEWCARIATAGAVVPKDGLTVRLREEYYRWWPNRGDGRTERLDRLPARLDAQFNDGLARLVMGYGKPDEVMGEYGMQAREAALPVIRTIFPARSCMLCPVDHF